MKKNPKIFFLLLFFSISISAQIKKNYKLSFSGNEVEIDLGKSFDLIFKGRSFSFRGDTDLSHLQEVLGPLAVPVLESKDGQFIAFFVLCPQFPKDSINRILLALNALVPVNYPDTLFNPVSMHINVIHDDLKYSLKMQDWNFSIEDYVYYYPAEKTKRMFNVDTLITYPIHFNKKIIYKDNFSSCQVWSLVKNNTGFIMIYCLYTANGKENKEYYLDLLSRAIRFK
jgi:hypothetical protein